MAFHRRLATATQNPLFAALVNSVNDVMIEVRLIGFASRNEPECAIADHTRILDRVREKDKAGARAAMVNHLAHSREIVQLVASRRKQLFENAKPAGPSS